MTRRRTLEGDELPQSSEASNSSNRGRMKASIENNEESRTNGDPSGIWRLNGVT